jgi:hypothetical protein
MGDCLGVRAKGEGKERMNISKHFIYMYENRVLKSAKII